jgi:hypothetical protein
MGKNKRNTLIICFVFIFVVAISYLMFESGITSKLKANVHNVVITSNLTPADLPIITLVINSTGEKISNGDASITVFAKSMHKINKIYYSYDLVKWYTDAYEKKEGTDFSAKLIFKEDINTNIYIKVENELGLVSYPYKTSVNLDNIVPTLEVYEENKVLYISAYDYNGISSIEYSKDGINWIKKSFNETTVNINENKRKFKYNYIRAVDTAGNISEERKVD